MKTAPNAPAQAPEQPGFWADERGAMILEYVLLLMGMFLMFTFMIKPIPPIPPSPEKLPALQNALMSFSRDAFEAMTMP
jgi:hypothetical protein